jgi:hypothetical protein
MSDVKPISSFCVERMLLTEDEFWKLVMFSAQPDNLDSERWEIELIPKYGWVSGLAEGEDTGKFWEFLVANKMDDRIDILRG